MQIVGYEAGSAVEEGHHPALLVAGTPPDPDPDPDGGGADAGGAEDPSGAAGDGYVSTGTADAAPGPATGGRRPVRRIPLDPGTELAYALGDRRCAGAVDADGHVACDRAAAPYCEAHRRTWVCAHCTGTCLKDEMDCYQDHAVYLAAFAPDTFKVGVTREARLRARLVEQGADRGVQVRSVSNGRIAREIEARIAERIPDRVRVPAKVRGMARPVDEDAWAALTAEFEVLGRVDPAYGLTLERAPVADTLAAGTVRGVKGRVLVLDHGGTTYAVDLRDLVGHRVDPGTPDRDLQSSLGAFG